MDEIFPEKLKSGDEVRVISPSRSLSIISQETRAIAGARLAELGLQVTFGEHAEEIDDFNSSSVASRVEDIHEAFSDTNVKGILTAIGGFNANQLLRDIDWSLIRRNPKVFCGFSDITALNNAFLAKSGLVSYSGVHYSSFGMRDYFDYSLESFKRCVMEDKPINIIQSPEWTDDTWFIDQDARIPVPSTGWLTINEGEAEGPVCGGNLSTLSLLRGTEYMPGLEGGIVFLEADEDTLPHHFDRNLVALLQLPEFSEVQGLVIGRFQRASKMADYLLKQIITTKKELANIPVIANVDFGHTSPMITYPVGGSVELKASQDAPSIVITKH